jgi:hypothetical protein
LRDELDSMVAPLNLVGDGARPVFEEENKATITTASTTIMAIAIVMTAFTQFPKNERASPFIIHLEREDKPDDLSIKKLKLKIIGLSTGKRMARRGGFEPPRPCGHRISNPAPYRAGPPPLLGTQWHASFKPFCHWKANDEF